MVRVAGEIRKIYKVTEYDLLGLAKFPGNMYACTDSNKMYEDVSTMERNLFPAIMLDTELIRLYNTLPANGKYYYVWETNALWLYNNGWQNIIGQTVYVPPAYNYSAGGVIEGTGSSPCELIDGNGLLRDGSVVVRDTNKLIKGRLYIDQTSNNFVFSSFLGGGMQFLPNGSVDDLGSLVINPAIIETTTDPSGKSIQVLTGREDGIGRFNGEWNTTQNMYVNLSGNHYMVWHEGNFDPKSLVLDSDDIVRLLNEYAPQPLPINVEKLQGKVPTDFADKVHTHVPGDITGLDTDISTAIEHALTTGSNKGITIVHDTVNDNYDFEADTFSIVLQGGVSGSGTIKNLTDTNITVTVDPLKHQHATTELKDWNEFLSSLDTRFGDKLDKTTFDDFVAEEIVTTPTPNKILRLDSSGLLPTGITGNAATSSKLATGRLISLTEGATGSAIFDGSTDVSIPVVVDPAKHNHTQYVLQSEVGNTVAPLDANKKVPIANLPDSVLGNLQYQGTFNPADGYPSDTPSKGQYWVAQGQGTINGQEYLTGDWIIYNGVEWEYLDNSGCVQSVNGQQGVVTITLGDLGGIPTTDIFDPNSPEINKIPATQIYSDPASGAESYVIPVGITGTAATAKAFAEPAVVTFTGDVTGNVTILGGGSTNGGLTITDLVSVAEPNKILKLNDDSKLPASIVGYSDGFNTAMTINFTGDVSGTASLTTTAITYEVPLTVTADLDATCDDGSLD